MKVESGTVSFERNEIAALLSFASKDCTRPTLYGVAVDPKNGVVFSTDGHRLLMWSTDPWPGASGLLKRDSVETIYKCSKRGQTILFAGNHLETGNLKLELDSFESIVPPAKQVIPPKPKKHSPLTIQGDLLMISMQAAAYLGGKRLRSAVTFYPPEEPLSPMLMLFDNSPEWKACIMPMRGNASPE